MIDILIIKIESNSDIIQDILDFLSQKDEYRINEVNLNRVLYFSGLVIDLEGRIVLGNGYEIEMSYNEFSALSLLASQPGRVFTKEQIYNAIYRDEEAIDIENAVYCLVSSLRKKLKGITQDHEYIQTVRGLGYKFIVPEE